MKKVALHGTDATTEPPGTASGPPFAREVRTKGFYLHPMDKLVNWGDAPSRSADDFRAFLLARFLYDAAYMARYTSTVSASCRGVVRANPTSYRCPQRTDQQMAPSLLKVLTRSRSAFGSSSWAPLPMVWRLLPLFRRGVAGCDRIVPVDIYVPGSLRPPRRWSPASAVCRKDQAHHHHRA